MTSAKTLDEHVEYIRQMVRLELWFIQRWLAGHPEETFSYVIRQRTGIYLKSDIHDGGPFKQIAWTDPRWLELEARAEELHARTRGDADSARFEGEGLAIFLPTLEARARADFERGLDGPADLPDQHPGVRKPRQGDQQHHEQAALLHRVEDGVAGLVLGREGSEPVEGLPAGARGRLGTGGGHLGRRAPRHAPQVRPTEETREQYQIRRLDPRPTPPCHELTHDDRLLTHLEALMVARASRGQMSFPNYNAAAPGLNHLWRNSKPTEGPGASGIGLSELHGALQYRKLLTRVVGERALGSVRNTRGAITFCREGRNREKE